MAKSDTPIQAEDGAMVSMVTGVCREADLLFQRTGGSSRHWVRDCFLPGLNLAGLMVVRGNELADLRAEVARLRDERVTVLNAKGATERAFLDLMAYVRGESPSLLTGECVDASRALETERAIVGTARRP